MKVYQQLGVFLVALATVVCWLHFSGFHSLPELVSSRTERVGITLPYAGFCGDIVVVKEGRELALPVKTISGGTAHLGLDLEPGVHDLTLIYDGMLPGEIKEYPIRVVVDQSPPPLEVSVNTPGDNVSVTADPMITLSGSTEPGARVKVEEMTFVPGREGKFEKEYRLKPGWNHLLVWAQDAAGNRTEKTFSLYHDALDPEIAWQFRPDAVFSERNPRLQVEATDDSLVRTVSGVLDNGCELKWVQNEQGLWEAATGELHDGYHTVKLKVTDESGRQTLAGRQFIVNSSEALGETTLGMGARGRDVVKLHERLSLGGFISGDADYQAQIFGEATRAALTVAQESKGLEPTGLADPTTIAALGPRILINLSEFALVLERPGRDPLHWNIASGSPAHPTPTGQYVIAEKVEHPTWLPPKSDWARDAKPIPPGPDNPLGTRWLGFDRGGVGIHGTNAPWSVGTASSHGCMRMVTGEVEKLFEMVEVGTPVIVYSGYESDPILSRYWGDKELAVR